MGNMVSFEFLEVNLQNLCMMKIVMNHIIAYVAKESTTNKCKCKCRIKQAMCYFEDGHTQNYCQCRWHYQSQTMQKERKNQPSWQPLSYTQEKLTGPLACGDGCRAMWNGSTKMRDDPVSSHPNGTKIDAIRIQTESKRRDHWQGPGSKPR